MKRVEKGCCGDCAKCQLLAAGEVDMIPCALDQILRRVARLERNQEPRPVFLAGECVTNNIDEDE